MRLDAYLAEYWPEYSRALWQKHCAQGFVHVNGQVVTEISKRLGEDDVVTVHLPEKKNLPTLDLEIVYEDDNVTVINKPTGALTHAKGAVLEEATVAEFMRPHTTFGADGNRPGIVHRLDRDTSGILIMAKNPETASLLGRQFSERKVKKTYIAIVEGNPKVPAARISVPIGRNLKAPATFKADKNGKMAETTYKVVAQNEKEALVILKPLTGRTHQLRVHMAHIGCPIKGDRIYGKPAARLFLHAWQLEITIPNGQRKVFQAPIPEEFMEAFTNAALTSS